MAPRDHIQDLAAELQARRLNWHRNLAKSDQHRRQCESCSPARRREGEFCETGWQLARIAMNQGWGVIALRDCMERMSRAGARF